MMMKALHEGGMPIMCAEYLDDLDTNPDDEGYTPNPGGLHEVGYANTFTPRFLRSVADYDLGLIKILYDAIVFLPRGDWKIIFMERDPEEINLSCQRVDKYIAFNRSKQLGQEEKDAFDKRQGQLKEEFRLLPFSCFRPYNQENIDHVQGIMEARSDVELIRVNYQEVIDNPAQVFERLKYTPLGKERMPIDIETAVSTINPDFHRVRK